MTSSLCGVLAAALLLPLPTAAAIEELVVRPPPRDRSAVTTPAADLPARDLADALRSLPGVALSGQGGLLQTFSVRGLGQERIRVLFDGAPLRALRRAGVDGAFLPLDWLQVTGNPSSAAVEEGAGSLGGTVHLTVRPAAGDHLQFNASGPDPSIGVQARGRRGPYSAGVLQRRAQAARSADGTRLDSGYRQSMALLQGDHASWRWRVLGADARDIGKASSRDPARRTRYPEDRHLLLLAGHDGADGSSLLGHLHHQRLDTRVRRGADVAAVSTRATDWGLRWSAATAWGRWGLDLEGREDLQTVEDGSTALDDGREFGAGLWVAGQQGRGAWQLDWGARLLGQQSSAAGGSRRGDADLVGHLGVSWQPAAELDLGLRLGRAVTWPTASQRFLTASTGRGGIVGNPGLEPEQARVLEASAGWTGRYGGLRATAFHMAVDDLIDRVPLDADRDTFRNTANADLHGLTLAAHWQRGPWRVDGRWQHLRGETSADAPLRDVPPDQWRLGIARTLGPGRLLLRADHREALDRAAPGNLPTRARTLLGLAWEQTLAGGLQVTLYGRNLLDTAAVVSIDELAPEEPRRSAGISLRLPLD